MTLRKIWFLAVAAAVIMGFYRLAAASEPTEMPRPSDFAMVELLAPKHGQVAKLAPRTIRVRVNQPGGPVPAGLKLHVALDGHRLDRQGRESKTPIILASGENALTIPIAMRDSGVHALEVYLVDYVPFSNRLTVKFGVNPMLKAVE